MVSSMMVVMVVFPSIVTNRIIRAMRRQRRRGGQHHCHQAGYHKDHYSAAQATTSFSWIHIQMVGSRSVVNIY
jgi:hypothetical protein